MRKSVSVMLFMALMFFSVNAMAAETAFELEIMQWMPDLTAEARITDDDIGGTDINFKDDLGLDDENFIDARFTWFPGANNRIRLTYSRISYSGDKVITEDIEFDGETYTAGTRVITDLDLQYIRLGWIWQFVDSSDGMFKLGTVLEAKVFNIDATLDAPDVDLKENEKVTGGLPTIGLALDFNPHEMVNIFAEASGMTFGDYGDMYDAEIGAKLIIHDNFTILANYRIFKINFEDDPDFVDIEISGPSFGASIRF